LASDPASDIAESLFSCDEQYPSSLTQRPERRDSPGMRRSRTAANRMSPRCARGVSRLGRARGDAGRQLLGPVCVFAPRPTRSRPAQAITAQSRPRSLPTIRATVATLGRRDRRIPNCSGDDQRSGTSSSSARRPDTPARPTRS
jgi:hypothetical protein